MNKWIQLEALVLCCDIEEIAPKYGCHVALTGGLLYKTGERKDADIMFYRIRQVEQIDIEGLFKALKRKLGIERVTVRHQRCMKAKYQGKNIDFFFPEEQGTYPG